MRSITPPINRFFDKVTIDDNLCWLWSGYTHKGYARFNTGSNVVEAHRWIYQELVGDIPKALQLDHLCRVRHCVNPDHLEPVTSRENTLRGNSIVALRAKQKYCLRGHILSGGNISYTRKNQRRCLQCHALRERARRLRNRLAMPV